MNFFAEFLSSVLYSALNQNLLSQYTIITVFSVEVLIDFLVQVWEKKEYRKVASSNTSRLVARLG